MRAITYEQLFLISIVVYAVYEIITLIKAKKINYLREVFKGLFFIYFQAVLYFTFYPLYIDYYAGNNFYINYVPIVETISMLQINLRIGLHNVFGNILMFVPLGMFIPFLFKKRDKFWYVFACGFLASLFIELNQLLLGGRTADIDDIILNTLGTIIGYILFKLIFKFIGKIKLVDKIYKKINNNNKSVIVGGLAILVPIFLILHIFIMVDKQHFLKTNSKTNEEIIEAFNELPNTELISSKKLNEEEHAYFIKEKVEDIEEEQLVLELYKKIRGDKVIKKDSLIVSKESDSKGNMLDYSIINNNEEYSSTVIVYGKLKTGDKIKFTYGNKEEIFNLKDEEYFFELLDISKYKVNDFTKVKLEII